MDTSQSRIVAQYELLRTLARLFPDPLVDLRDRVGRLDHASNPGADVTNDAAEPKRSPRSDSHTELVREAKERLKALTPDKKHALDLAESLESESVQSVKDLSVALNDWVERWHLHSLMDFAPDVLRYWAKRPAEAERLFFPKIRLIRPSPRINPELELHHAAQPVLADPDSESEADFIERARQHYEARAEALLIQPHHRRRKLRQHAEWYLRSHVQGWTAERIATEETTEQAAPDLSTITKGIQRFAELLIPPSRLIPPL